MVSILKTNIVLNDECLVPSGGVAQLLANSAVTCLDDIIGLTRSRLPCIVRFAKVKVVVIFINRFLRKRWVNLTVIAHSYLHIIIHDYIISV